MNNKLKTIIKLVISFGLMWGIGQLILSQFPWWITAVIAAGVCFFVPIKSTQSFAIGMTVFSLLWGMQAYSLSTMNMDLLATKMGELFGGFTPMQLVYATAAIGGVIGAFGAMTGSLFRQVFFPMSKKEEVLLQNNAITKEAIS